MATTITEELTETEACYLEQGYALPEGWTWREVHQTRERQMIGSLYVPLASVGGVVGWGVPYVNGHAMRRYVITHPVFAS